MWILTGCLWIIIFRYNDDVIILSAFTFDGCTLKYLQKNLYAVRDMIQNNKLGRGEPVDTDE